MIISMVIKTIPVINMCLDILLLTKKSTRLNSCKLCYVMLLSIQQIGVKHEQYRRENIQIEP